MAVANYRRFHLTPVNKAATVWQTQINQSACCPHDKVVMLVDNTRHQHPILAGDFRHDDLYIADHATTKTNQMETTGLTSISNLYQQQTVRIQPYQKITAEFHHGTATLNAVIDGKYELYTLTKMADTLPLSDIIGTHIDTKGRELTIHQDGSFIENDGICLIEGQLKRHHFYFNITAQVSHCADERYNGTDYEGVLLTINLDGQNHIITLITHDDHVLWEDLPAP